MLWTHTFDTDFSLTSAFSDPKFNYKTALSLDNPHFWGMVGLFIYFATPNMKPFWFQRISMGSSIAQTKKAFLISTVILIALILSILWIPFLMWNINPNIESGHLLAYMIDNYAFTGLKGLLIVAIAAMAMSTADSYINASSVLFAHDLCKPLNIWSKHELFTSKAFALLLGMGSIMISITTNDLLWMHILANVLYMPLVTPVVIITVLGFRASTKAVFIGIIAAVITMAVCEYIGLYRVKGIMFAMAANSTCMILSHYALRQAGRRFGNKEEGRYLEQAA